MFEQATNVEYTRTMMGRTHIIATQVFTVYERMIFAITDDDVANFDKLGVPI